MYIYIYVSTHSFFVVNTILVCIYVYMSYNCWESCISHASGLGSLVSQAKRIIQIQFFYIAGNFENIPDFRGPGLKTFSKTIPMESLCVHAENRIPISCQGERIFFIGISSILSWSIPIQQFATRSIFTYINFHSYLSVFILW